MRFRLPSESHARFCHQATETAGTFFEMRMVFRNVNGPPFEV